MMKQLTLITALFFSSAITHADETINGMLTVDGHLTLLQGYEKLYWGSYHDGGANDRSYLAPMKSDGSGYDWNKEFGYQNATQAWYFESKLGIGNNNPGAILDIQGEFVPGYMQLAIRPIGVDNRSGISFWNTSSQRIGVIYAGNEDYIISNEGAGSVRLFAGGNERMKIQSDGNIGIGTATPDHKLDVIGTIRAQEIIVSTEGADFVFDDKYELKSLSEVESHIQSYGHLPDVPSAQTMRTEGVAISEMQTKLLQKVEELTLYVIELKKENELQQKEIEKLKTN